MSLKAKVEALIYAAEEPITLEQIALLLKDIVLADLASAQENAAIEQADSAAELAATAYEDGALLPELSSQSAELISPEPGPLMPDHEGPDDAVGTEENTADQGAPEDIAPEDEAREEAAPEEGATEEVAEEPTAGEKPLADEPAAIAGEPVPTAVEPLPVQSATVEAPETNLRKRQPKKSEKEIAEIKAVRARLREVLTELVTDYASEERGMEIRQVAGGFRMATKPEHHDVVRAFAKSLKPPIRLSLAALETLAVIAYKQPVTAPEIAEIRGVESASVLGTLLDRKLITTAGRKQVIGRPMQYKTSKDFLLRFGLNDVNELPSMEEFSQLASEGTIEIAPPERRESPSLFEPEGLGVQASSSEEPPPEAEIGVLNNPESRPDKIPAEDQLAGKQDAGAPGGDAEAESPPETSNEGSLDLQSNDQVANDQGSRIPELPKQDAAEAADSQPRSEAESNNEPEAEHPIDR